MKLRELVGIMNIADVGVMSRSTAVDIIGVQKIDMFDLANDPILRKHGDREVVTLTNVAKRGDVIEIM